MRINEIKLDIIIKLIQAEIQGGLRSLSRFDSTDENAIENAEKIADYIIRTIDKEALNERSRIRKSE